ncbi:MAG: radical SAM protein [bacterium]
MTSKKKTMDTLKLLITDGCNLSCTYCVPEPRNKRLPRKKGLRHGELLRLVRALMPSGIVNLDFRGGEPLIKKWFFPFLEEVVRTPQFERISVMTNGVLLKEHAAMLRDFGLKRLLVHIDSLSFEKYRKITRGDHLYRIYAGLQEAVKAGFERIGVYVTILNGLNQKEIIEFALLTKDHPYEVVFLEYVPYDAAETNSKRRDLHYPLDKIIEEIDYFQKLREDDGSGVYRFEDGMGTIRFLRPVDEHQCESCTRIVLTTEGLLGPCFLTDKFVDLRPLLTVKEGQETQGVSDALRQAVRWRPRKLPRQEKPFRMCGQLSFLDE